MTFIKNAYKILRYYGIPPDNFDFHNMEEWGVDLENVPLTEDEKDQLIDEIIRIM